MIMTDEEIKQNAEEYANSMYGKKYQNELWKECYMIHIAGAHSRDEEIKHLEEHLERTSCDIITYKAQVEQLIEQLRNPWISVDERLPEEDVYNISIPVVAITNNGYWFKGHYNYNNEDWLFSEGTDFDFLDDEFVTHWMHIPELKKGE